MEVAADTTPIRTPDAEWEVSINTSALHCAQMSVLPSSRARSVAFGLAPAVGIIGGICVAAFNIVPSAALLSVFFVVEGLLLIPLFLMLFDKGYAAAGVDGLYHRALWSRWFLPWTKIGHAWKYSNRPLRGREPVWIEVALVDGGTVVIVPRDAASDTINAFFERLCSGIEQRTVVLPPPLLDPVIEDVEPAALRGLVEHGRTYRQRPVSHADLWKVVREPNGSPAVRAVALAALGAAPTLEERAELAAMADATAHPHLRSIMLASSSGKPVASLDRLALLAVRNPIAMPR